MVRTQGLSFLNEMLFPTRSCFYSPSTSQLVLSNYHQRDQEESLEELGDH